MTYTLTIEPKKTRRGRVRKGRTFTAHLLSYLTANASWDSGSGDAHRPVYLSYATTDQEARAFTANLRTGRPAVVRNEYGHDKQRLEILKSSPHRFAFQRLNGTSIVTAFLPDLFELDPGLLHERITFVFAPPTWWTERQLEAPALAAFADDERRELVMAAYFAAYLDRRTPLPIINDAVFHRQLFRAAQDEPWFRRPSGNRYGPGFLYLFPEDVDPVGLETAALVDVRHDDFEVFLRNQTTLYYRNEVPRHGTDRIPGCRRLLPHPSAAPRQLSLFDLLDRAA